MCSETDLWTKVGTPRRLECAMIREYPFSSGLVFQRLTGAALDVGHPLSAMVWVLENWEQRVLFGQYNQPGINLRKCVRWNTSYTGHSLPEEVKGPVWEKVCNLFTVYALLDQCGRNKGLGPLPPISGHQENTVIRMKSLEKGVIDKIRFWEKLENWMETLKEAREAQEKAKRSSKEMPPEAGHYPHFALLLGLARSRVKYRYETICYNFRLAALYIACMLRIPGVGEDEAVLPGIPDKLTYLLKLENSGNASSTKWEDSRQEVQAYCQCPKITPSKLRLPLHLALIISPLCLLNHRAKDWTSCDRERVLEVSESLGNYRPAALKEMEKSILDCLFRVAFKPENIDTELDALVHSNIWRKCEALQPSSEAARFFIPDQGSHITVPKEMDAGASTMSLVGSQVGMAKQTKGPNDIDNPMGDEMGTPRTTAPPAPTTQLPTTSPILIPTLTLTTTQSTTPATVTTRPPASTSSQHLKTSSDNSTTASSEGYIFVEEGEGDKEGLREDEEAGLRQEAQDVRMNEKNEEGDGARESNGAMDEDVIEEDNEGGSGETADEAEAGQPDDEEEEEVGQGNPPPPPLRKSEREPPAPKASMSSKQSTRKRKRTKGQPSTTEKVDAEVDDAGDEQGYIDIDLWMERVITLDVRRKPKKLVGSPMKVHLLDGTTTEIIPYVHDKRTLQTLEKLWKAVESNYVNGAPRHLQPDEDSAFLAVTAARMDTMEWKEVQTNLETRHLVVRAREEYKEPPLKMALLQLGSLETVMTIQDLSIVTTANQNNRRREGTLRQLLEAAESENGSGKVLNALDIGLPVAGMEENGYASNVTALSATRGEWRSSVPPPLQDVNWALAATAGAFHTWHIDCNGFMTFVSPVCGQKLWIVGYPIKGKFKDFMKTDLFSNGKYDLNGANEKLWKMEAVLLGPGDKLVMRPNTPHAVFTPCASVVRGGHCYAASTLPDTLAGIIHSFIVGELVTNTEHRSARFHLQEMVSFYHRVLIKKILDEEDRRGDHVPSMKTDVGHNELLAICVFGVLINVLDFGTYVHPLEGERGRTSDQLAEMIDKDLNTLTHEKRNGCRYTRVQSLQLLEYITKCYKMEGKGRWRSITDYHEDAIAHQCAVIYNYKVTALKDKLNGAPGCDLKLLETQLRGVAVKGSSLAQKISSTLGSNDIKDMALLELDVNLEWKGDKVEQACISGFKNPLEEAKNERDTIYWAARICKVEQRDVRVSAKKRKTE